jgi:DNA-binding SARP family transcriptional activator
MRQVGMPVWLGVLGPLQVVADGAQEPPLVSAGRLRALLAVLLWRANQPVPVDELSELVWDGAPPAGASAAVRALVLRLRRALGQQAGARIRTRAPGYLIEVSEDELDAAQFAALCRDTASAVRAGSWAEAALTATAALKLWRGTPLADLRCQAVQDSWAPHLEQDRLQVLEWRIEADLRLGREDRVVSELRDLVALHPLRERFHAQLMLALAGLGRQAEALEAYQGARRVLIDQLGIEPGPELRALQDRVLRGDAAMSGGTPAPESAHQPDGASQPSTGVPCVRPVQLPSGTWPFVGRDDQFQQLSRHLLSPAPAATPLALITGMGGSGKTELAVRWAHQAAARFPDGQLYLDLQGYSLLPPLTPVAALGSLLRALGVSGDQVPDSPQEMAGLFRSKAAGRRLLLLLDNARSAEQVRPLVPGEPGCAVLVTSRDRLDGLVASNGARRIAVDTLPTPDAVALLRQLLGVTHSATELARLAQACAGLPLALRIAAAQLDGASTATLSRHIDLLETGAWSRTLQVAGDESASVQAAFQLSYDVLGGAEQEQFRLLGLMPTADFSVAAAAALAGIDVDEASRRLDRLTTAHLVARGGEDRYTLHDLLRSYAAGLVETAELAMQARRRLAGWYLRTVRSAAWAAYPHALRLPGQPEAGPLTSGGGPAEAQDWLDLEHHNIMAVITHAATVGAGDLAGRLAFAYRPHLYARSHVQAMHDAGATVLAAAQAAGDVLVEAAARLTLGLAAEQLGALAEADEHMRRAAELCATTGWAEGQAAALSDLGVVRLQGGRLDEAAAAFDQTIAVTRKSGDHEGEALATANLGLLLAMSGRLREGVDKLRQAADYYGEFGPRRKLTPALVGLGEAYRQLGEFARARTALAEAVAIGVPAEEPFFTCAAWGTLAGLCCDLGEFAEARDHLDRADALVEQTGLMKLRSMTAVHHGWFELAQGMTGADRAWFDTVVSYGDEAGDPWHRARGLVGVAACLRADRQARACVRAAVRALCGARRSGHRLQLADAHLELAMAHTEFGDPRRARAHARAGARIAEECGYWAAIRTATSLLTPERAR